MTRRQWLAIALVLLSTLSVADFTALSPRSASAQVSCPGQVRPGIAYAMDSVLTVSNTALGLTVSKLTSGANAADFVVITVETASIRYTEEGTTPTASIGHTVTSGNTFRVCGSSLGNFKMIRATATDAVVTITYYRKG